MLICFCSVTPVLQFDLSNVVSVLSNFLLILNQIKSFRLLSTYTATCKCLSGYLHLHYLWQGFNASHNTICIQDASQSKTLSHFIVSALFCKPVIPPSCHFHSRAREDTNCMKSLQGASLSSPFFRWFLTFSIGLQLSSPTPYYSVYENVYRLLLL